MNFFFNLLFFVKMTTLKKIQEYKGVMLFDIDGTWTVSTQTDRRKIITLLNDKKYAIGINTAAPYIIDFFDIQPNNQSICEFLRQHDYNTYNSVNMQYPIMAGITVPTDTEHDPFDKIYEYCSRNSDIDFQYGFRKAFALEYALKIYNLPDSCGTLIDDNEIVKKGFEEYCKIKKLNMKFIWTPDGLKYENISNFFDK